MKLVRARFENFRLLRDLKLDFSTDPTKKLTVIRAENATGKTTILNALQWALYDDAGLPGGGKDYRLSPIDWDLSAGKSVPVYAEVDFETTETRWTKNASKPIETTKRYRIVRTVLETLDGTLYKRRASTVKLFQLTHKGAEPIDHPDALIAQELPLELREIFFTDGDRALNFIEAEDGLRKKRERVEGAIRSLLGLEVIEAARKHVTNTVSAVKRETKDFQGEAELRKISSDLKQRKKEAKELKKSVKDSEYQSTNIDQKLVEIEKDIEVVLRKGDQEKLQKDLDETKGRLESLDAQQDAAAKEHGNLFKGKVLARDLLSPVLEKGFQKLSVLRDAGKIPHATVPVLEERLKGTTCICGESLAPNNPESRSRIEHIQHLIQESRQADALQNVLADLYYGARASQLVEGTDDRGWDTEYTRTQEQRLVLDSQRDEQGKKLKALEAQLKQIGNTNIQGLLATQRDYTEQRDRFNQNRVQAETQLQGLRAEEKQLRIRENNLLSQQKKTGQIRAQLEVAQDVQSVLNKAHDRITTEELEKVSRFMNQIFLEMIVADPKQGAIIRKTEISKVFDILAYGPKNRRLDPDRDLNGASRRALTLAFILALTKVSEVEAPNVIDTPLGMMSGHVKRSVLKTAVRESSQLVLLLTRSEIADCEDILDAEAGQMITLTNTAHYPKMVVNKPPSERPEVLRCDCSHREECDVCERRST